MTAPPIQPGDTFLLFDNFPYDFKEPLPLAVGPNVYLDVTPQSVLDEINPPLADLGFGLSQYYCLRSPVAEVRQSGLEPSDLFFLSITALRLRAPLAIKVVLQFKREGNTSYIKPFLSTSSWQPMRNAQYLAEDIRLGAKIAERQLELYNSDYKRIISAMVLFSQVTCGFSKSFQMAYLALFAALEALFVSKEEYAKAKPLARRAANFLSSFKSQFSAPLKDWLEEEYKCGRNKLVHGVQDVVPWSKELSEEKRLVFGQLHEIARLSILGFMSDNTKLESLSRNTGKQLQKELDSLSPATGQFLNGQRVWCT